MKLNCKRIDLPYTSGEEIFTFPEESGLPFLFDVEEELTAAPDAMDAVGEMLDEAEELAEEAKAAIKAALADEDNRYHSVAAFFMEFHRDDVGQDISALSAANFPVDMEEDFKFPMVKIKMDSKTSYPSWQDFSEMVPDEDDDDAFGVAWEELTGEDPEDPDDRSQLLGWPDVIQNSMFAECDLVTQGYYLGNGWVKIPKEVRQQAEEMARDRWMLLFQLDTVELGDFELMFGDCGHIYFYITKEDLAARRFDRIWLILQCY